MSEPLDDRFRAAVGALPTSAGPAGPSGAVDSAAAGELLAIFDSQAESRHLDLLARRLRAAGQGFYTIASAGHEANAAVAAALRPTDPALLHYRSGAFYLRRARQAEGHDGIRDVVLGLRAAAAEPIAGGRHKVFGSAELAVIPQTSTIASHLPRAVGLAFGIERAARLAVRRPWPADALVFCSFGDASANHSTAAGAFNAAAHAAFQRVPLPLLLCCEDNGLGISVRTPRGWIAAAFSGRAGLRYFFADGVDTEATLATARDAAGWVRTHRAPAFLHLSCVRFLGHAGSDAEIGYRTPAEIDADLARDPLLGTAAALVRRGVLDPAGVLGRYAAAGERVSGTARRCAGARVLSGASEVMAPIAPRQPDAVAAAAAAVAPADRRTRAFGGRLPETEGPLTLAQSINRALLDVLAARPEVVVFGEDVARKGGVYGVTMGLHKRFGGARVFDTVLDEQTILGLALGSGLAGLLPIPEIQYLAYLHNAEDQLRGEAATLQFFSTGQFRNPLVVRIASLAYQRGFGGHFHNDNSLAVLRDVPGVVVAVPARPDDAAAMLRTCVAAAAVDGTVCCYCEPIALYHTRDLHALGDAGWLAPYAPPERWAAAHVPLGRARTYGVGTDLTVLTFGNGVRMCLRVAARLAAKGIGVRVVDLRWIAPLPVADLLAQAAATGRVLVVDETRRTGGVSEGVAAALLDAGFAGPAARVCAADSFIPLGDAALDVLPSESDIADAALRLVRGEAASATVRDQAAGAAVLARDERA